MLNRDLVNQLLNATLPDALCPLIDGRVTALAFRMITPTMIGRRFVSSDDAALRMYGMDHHELSGFAWKVIESGAKYGKQWTVKDGCG